MNTYIGTRIVRAEPFTEHQYFERRGIPYEKRTYDRPGFLIVCAGGDEGWSPKEVFEAVYHLMSDDEVMMVCGGAA